MTNDGFTQISMFDRERWYNQPDQLSMLENNDRSLYFDMKAYDKVSVNPYSSPAQDGWYLPTVFASPDIDGIVRPSFRHNFECDMAKITLRYYPEGHFYDATGNGITVTVPLYLHDTNSLLIFKNGRKMSNSEFKEDTSTTIKFNEIVQPTDDLKIFYKTATLKEGVHYNHLNSNIVSFKSSEIFSQFLISDMVVWGLRVNKEAVNPLKLIDKKSKTVVKTVQTWHPFYGYHFIEAYKNIDIEKPEDPAIYNVSVLGRPDEGGFLPWGRERKGTIWMDTADLYYRRYHDTNTLKSVEEQIKQWGQLADFGECRVYEWVESNVPPSEWDALAKDEENNLSISDDNRKSGIAWQPLFEKDDEGNWILFQNQYETFDAIIDGEPLQTTGYLAYLFQTQFRNDDTQKVSINVYVNGYLRIEDLVIPDDGIIEIEGINPEDRVHFVRIPTTNEELIEELIEAEILLRDYQYTANIYYDEVGSEIAAYYFWVRNKKSKSSIEDKTMPVSTIEKEIVESTEPYCFFLKPVEPKTLHYEDDFIEIPWRMSRVVVRGLRGLIDGNYRYVLRFTRDFTLRDSLDHGETPLDLKNLHEEWQLIRQEQKKIIERNLWDRITESIVGRKLGNVNEPVPAYDREIYDLEYDTETRYGLGDGQSFTDGTLSKDTIVKYLRDEENDFYPVDIDSFFRTNTFDTEEGTIAAMDTVFSIFPYNHVNRMFFSVLLDALSVKHEYPGIIKTSMIALHSIIILDDQGKFDD